MDFKNIDIDIVFESILTLSIPLEILPDVGAWICSALVVLWILTRRPRLFCSCAAVWLVWLLGQVIAYGPDVLENVQRRGVRALEVTDKFAANLVLFIKAWTDFFLPFLSDVSRWAVTVWRSMDVRQKIGSIFGLITCYSVIEAIRFVRKHSKTIRRVVFHASFLIGGPVIWSVCGLLPSDWLETILSLAITVVPTLISLCVLGEPLPSTLPIEDKAAPRAKAARSRRSTGGGTYEDIDHFWYAGRRRWLSYWSCWPLLALLKVGLGKANSDLQYDLRRAMTTFVIWLIFWEGSIILQFTMETVLGRTMFMDKMVGFFGARSAILFKLVGGGGVKAASGLATGSSWRIFRWISALGSRLWMVVIGVVLVSIVFAALVWLFYSAVSVVAVVVTTLLWCFAAADTSDTLMKEIEDLYNRKLAFWVLAMVWEAMTMLPLVGFILKLFTPIAFSLWLVAGESISRRVLLPVVGVAVSFGKKVLASVRSTFRNCCCPARDEEDEEEEDDYAEGDEEEEEALEDVEEDSGERVTNAEDLSPRFPAVADEAADTSVACTGGDSTPKALPEDSGNAGAHADNAPKGDDAAAVDAHSRDDTGGTGGVDDTGGTGGVSLAKASQKDDPGGDAKASSSSMPEVAAGEEKPLRNRRPSESQGKKGKQR